MPKNKHVTVIGAGISGLAAAALTAREGYDTHVFEKNSQPGGRAGVWHTQGFTFDMGPSWYWMPGVFEDFYKLFGHTTADFYELEHLDPSYRVFFGGNDVVDVPAGRAELDQLAEKLEPGGAARLEKYLAQARYKYNAGMGSYVFKPGHSVAEFMQPNLMLQGLRLDLLGNMRSHINKYFNSTKMRQLLEFPILFLGAKPSETPALYSLMNYADLALGTWYPKGGLTMLAKAFARVAVEQGATIHYNQPVTAINTHNGRATGVVTAGGTTNTDMVLAAADYNFVEQQLLPPPNRRYTGKYWNNRRLAPSCLIFYIGLNKKLPALAHHNLFFDEDFDAHAVSIYDTGQWPEKPLFYVCAPSRTDASVAPEGCENLFILMPVAPGIHDTTEIRQQYYHMLMERLESYAGTSIRDGVIVNRSYAINDFVADYHAYKGNAYGLANTLAQTAFLKPKMRAKNLSNMFFCGQLTTPGPGLPPSVISGRVAAAEAIKVLRNL